MNKKTKSPHIILILMVLAVVFLGGFYFFVIFNFFSLQQQAVNTVVDEITIDQNIKKEAGSGDVLKKYFVKAGEEANLISLIEDQCKVVFVSCSINSIEEGGVVSEAPVKNLRMTVRSSGGFDNTMQLLRVFEFYSYPIIISNITLSSGGTSNTSSSTKSVLWNGSFDVTLPVLVN